MEGIIAAGATAPPELRELGIERIPLLTIGGETLLDRACRCLKNGGGCDRIHVFTPREVPLAGIPGVAHAGYSGGLITDLLRCLEDDVASEYVLVSSGDMPLISEDAVTAVVKAGVDTGADVLYPVVEKGIIEEMFPGTRRTYLNFRGRRYSGGNVFMLNRTWVLDHRDWIDAAFRLRKKPVAIMQLLGLGFLFRVAFGFAGLDYVEEYLGNLVGGKFKAEPLEYPELAVDLDKLADLELFRSHLDPVTRI